MTSLRSLPLDGNPLKSIRREVVAGGWVAGSGRVGVWACGRVDGCWGPGSWVGVEKEQT